MQVLQPEIAKINERYPKPEDAMESKEPMNLYKGGVSPMGGFCLHYFFPILWAMFRFFPASIEPSNLHDRPFFSRQHLGLGTRIPCSGSPFTFCLLMAITMWAYNKLMMNNQTASNDPNARAWVYELG